MECNVSYKNELDWEDKLTKFRSLEWLKIKNEKREWYTILLDDNHHNIGLDS